MGLPGAAHHQVRPDPGERVEAAASGWRQRPVHEGQQNQGQGRMASQGV